MSPAARRLLYLLLSKEWVSGNEMFEVAGTRYGARLNDLKKAGYSWEKRWIKGRSVPLYHIILPGPEQLTLDHVDGPTIEYVELEKRPGASHPHRYPRPAA